MSVELENMEFLRKQHECKIFTRKLTWLERSSRQEIIYVGMKIDH